MEILLTQLVEETKNNEEHKLLQEVSKATFFYTSIVWLLKDTFILCYKGLGISNA